MNSANLVDDAVGVEFLGAVDVVETMGASIELTLRFGDILGEQLRFARDDYQKASSELKELTSVFDLPRLGNRHVERRVMHGIAGIVQWNQALLAEQMKLLEMNDSLWTPFRKLLESERHLD